MASFPQEADAAGGAEAAGGGIMPESSPDEESSMPVEMGLQDVRENVLRAVETRMEEKAQELKQKGQDMLHHIEQKHKECQLKLQKEVQACQAYNKMLDDENVKLKCSLAQLAARLFMISGKVGGPEAFPPDLKAAAAQSVPQSPTVTEAFVNASSPVAAMKAAMEPPPGLHGAMALPRWMTEQTLGDAKSGLFPGFGAESGSAPATPVARTPSEALGFFTPVGFDSPLQVAAPTVGTFSFTIRKADEADLGLKLTMPEAGELTLVVEEVKVGGAVHSWNRLCEGHSSTKTDKMVRAGDRIVCVNGASGDPKSMLHELQTKQLVKITIARGETLTVSPSLAAFRLDAPPFVPAVTAAAAAVAATADNQ